MGQPTEPLIDQFRKLEPTEKIRLVQELWDEIAAEASDLPLTAKQQRLLDDRIDEHDANPEDVEPWDAARDEILRRL